MSTRAGAVSHEEDIIITLEGMHGIEIYLTRGDLVVRIGKRIPQEVSCVVVPARKSFGGEGQNRFNSGLA